MSCFMCERKREGDVRSEEDHSFFTSGSKLSKYRSPYRFLLIKPEYMKIIEVFLIKSIR